MSHSGDSGIKYEKTRKKVPGTQESQIKPVKSKQADNTKEYTKAKFRVTVLSTAMVPLNRIYKGKKLFQYKILGRFI